jgi:uncharacterized protein DUF6627
MRMIIRSSIAIVLAYSILLIGPGSTARAATVATEELIVPAVPEAPPDRDALVRDLVRLGVDPAEAQRRVDALTPEEVATVQGRLSQLPAGGFVGEVVGALLIVFIVLLITDIAGLTDVFPFVKKPAQRARH